MLLFLCVHRFDGFDSQVMVRLSFALITNMCLFWRWSLACWCFSCTAHCDPHVRSTSIMPDERLRARLPSLFQPCMICWNDFYLHVIVECNINWDGTHMFDDHMLHGVHFCLLSQRSSLARGMCHVGLSYIMFERMIYLRVSFGFRVTSKFFAPSPRTQWLTVYRGFQVFEGSSRDNCG